VKSTRLVAEDVGADASTCPDCGQPCERVFAMERGYSLWCSCPFPTQLRPDGTPRAVGEVFTLDEIQAAFERSSSGAPRRRGKK
jgi:hypothetical protein